MERTNLSIMGLDVDVETYLIPGFKIFEHFFAVPLGIYRHVNS